jgi:hypothetical protein
MRRVRRGPEDRRCRRPRAPAEGGARTAALHLRQRTLDHRQREGRRARGPDEEAGGRRHGHVCESAEDPTLVAIHAARGLVVVLREKDLFGRWERGRLRVSDGEENQGACAYFEALVLHEGCVQFSGPSLVIQVDSGVGQQITLPCLAPCLSVKVVA